MQTFISQLKQLNKPFYTFADIAKVTNNLPLPSLKVALTRAVKSGTLQRLRRGLYIISSRTINPKGLTAYLYLPAYVSFETALAEYGIMSQIPYTITCATTKRSKRLTIADTEIEYRQLKPDLFFGYEKSGDYFMASPEKALLDSIYLVSMGKLSLNLEGLDLTGIKRQRLSSMVKSFSPRVKKLVMKILPAAP
ncbi:MAG: hypothetical protein WC659_05805 [Patescibacteria group bacterium]